MSKAKHRLDRLARHLALRYGGDRLDDIGERMIALEARANRGGNDDAVKRLARARELLDLARERRETQRLLTGVKVKP
jgi:hypothetical protein